MVLCSMWDLSSLSGTKPMPPELGAQSPNTGPSGKSLLFLDFLMIAILTDVWCCPTEVLVCLFKSNKCFFKVAEIFILFFFPEQAICYMIVQAIFLSEAHEFC